MRTIGRHCRTPTVSTMKRLATLMVSLALSASWPANTFAACDPHLVMPESVSLTANDNLLFYGDSITAGAPRNPHHYATLFELLAKATYCELEDLQVTAKGRRGSHYARYDRLAVRVLREAEPQYTKVVFQDAGKALRLEHPLRPDSSRVFANAIEGTVAATLMTAPDIQVYLATTPGLDELGARRKFVRLYGRQNNWEDHNDATRLAAQSLTASQAIPWDEAFCQVYAEGPDVEWTFDGVHPDLHGHLLLALANLKYFGIPRADLNLSVLEDPDLGIEIATANDIADLAYQAPSQTCAP